MKVNVMGTGYVGLVSGVCLASKGHQVSCFDVDSEVINTLNKGIPHIKEAGLEELLTQVIARGLFEAKHVSENRITDCDLILIAVGTPSNEGKIDLTYIEKAIKSIGKEVKKLEGFVSIVVKSTVLPGTVDTVVRAIIEETSGKKMGEFGLGMNPEFLREGHAVEDFLNPDRIVLGYEDGETLDRLQQLYKPWSCDKISVNSRTAEMTKYASNCLLATQIYAANELANIASAIKNIDIMDVMKGVHSDKRWSPVGPSGERILPEILNYLVPGCGFGGSCLPKDLQALQNQSDDYGVEISMLNAVFEINKKQPAQILKLLKGALGELSGKNILFLGLSFKPDTEDIRESVSIKIIRDLLKEKALVHAHDPMAISNSKREFSDEKGIEFIEEWEELLFQVDAVVVATKWEEYKELSTPKLRNKMKGKILVDARRFFSHTDFPDSQYLTIGHSIVYNALDRASEK
ncbi:MAG: UDP-glucose/GDP-mannose dehydrogenase family protein [Pseudomonadota bacterium]|nr:UDP-glucose/GDP-mannose dehydrogenase family protein [Pseudomonadota bacterium]